MANQEIEIKVKVSNPALLIQFLQQHATFEGESHQCDAYFSPAHRDFLAKQPIHEWFRLREDSKGCSLNYKCWHYTKEGKSYNCDEYETPVGDRGAVENILKALNFVSLVVVDKNRSTWRFETYEIALDQVEGLGDFVEVEYKGEDKTDPKAITDAMVRFLREHGCVSIERNYQGYPFLLLFPDRAQYEMV